MTRLIFCHHVSFGKGVFITDTSNNVWVQGLKSDNCEIRPIKTTAILEPDEYIVVGEHYESMLVFKTTRNRFFVFDVDCESLRTTCLPTLNLVRIIDNVKEFTLIGQTIIFEMNDSYYLINHLLSIDVESCLIKDRLKLVPIMVDDYIPYYQIVFDEKMKVPMVFFDYRTLAIIFKERQTLHMLNKTVNGDVPMNLILTAPNETHDTMIDSIEYANNFCCNTAKGSCVHKIINGQGFSHVRTYDDIACRYNDQTRTLDIIHVAGKSKFINDQILDRKLLVYINGNTISNPDGSSIINYDNSGCKLNLETVSVIYEPNIVVLNHSSNKLYEYVGNLLCVSTKFDAAFYPMKIGLLIYVNNDLLLITPKEQQSHILEKIDSVVTSEHVYHIYKVNAFGEVDCITCMDDQVVYCFVKYAKIVRIEFLDNRPVTAWIMEPENNDPIVRPLIFYHEPSFDTIIVIRSLNNCFDQLMTIVRDCNSKFRIKISVDGNNDDYMRKLFIEKTIKDFKTRFLIEREGTRLVDLNPQCTDLTGKQRRKFMNNVGQALHMLIIMVGSSIDIRLPLEIVSSIIYDSELSVEDLDYFCNLNCLDTQSSTFSCTKGIKYRKHLKNLLQFNIESDHQHIANGFLEYQSVANLWRMNVQTLYAYISNNY